MVHRIVTKLTLTLVVLDPGGSVVARGGVISDAGGAGGDNSFYICGIAGKTY